MITWPTTVPQTPSKDSYSLGSPQNAIWESEMSVGPPKKRPLTTSARKPLSMVIPVLTKEETQDFLTFYEETIAYGTLPFTMTDPVTNSNMTVEFRGTTGHYTLSTISSVYFQLSLSLEVL